MAGLGRQPSRVACGPAGAWRRRPAGRPAIQVSGTYLGSVADCHQLLSQLYTAVSSAPLNPGNVYLTSYLEAMMIQAGCGSYSYSECHLPSQTKDGKLPRVPSYAKSDFFSQQIPAAGIQALIAGIEQMRGVQGAAGGLGEVLLDALGGAINRMNPSATAFVHRNSLFLAQYLTRWNEGGSTIGASHQHAWLRSLYASLHPYASGQADQNYADPDLTNWQQAYYGANYARLSQVKAAYDPQQVFRFPQGITPAPCSGKKKKKKPPPSVTPLAGTRADAFLNVFPSPRYRCPHSGHYLCGAHYHRASRGPGADHGSAQCDRHPVGAPRRCPAWLVAW